MSYVKTQKKERLTLGEESFRAGQFRNGWWVRMAFQAEGKAQVQRQEVQEHSLSEPKLSPEGSLRLPGTARCEEGFVMVMTRRVLKVKLTTPPFQSHLCHELGNKRLYHSGLTPSPVNKSVKPTKF